MVERNESRNRTLQDDSNAKIVREKRIEPMVPNQAQAPSGAGPRLQARGEENQRSLFLVSVDLGGIAGITIE